MNARQIVSERVKDAFHALGTVRSRGQDEKYARHYDAIANYLLSVPGTDEYKFLAVLTRRLRDRGCVFVTPATCSNRQRMEEASKELEKPGTSDPGTMFEECRKRVRTNISNGVNRTAMNAFVSPSSGLPAWFRVVESGFDAEVCGYYMEDAKEELAKDPVLADYIRGRYPEWIERSAKWSN